MKQLQKIIPILLIPLLLCGCRLRKQRFESEQSYSSVSSNLSTEPSKSSSSLNTEFLIRYNLTSDDQLTDGYEAQKIRSHQILFSEDMQGPFVFQTHQELANFSSLLKAKFYEEYGDKNLYGNYRVMYEFLDKIDPNLFDDNIAILTPSFMLSSGSLHNEFEGLYLKNDGLYICIMIDAYARHSSDAAFTMDIVWETFMIFVNKSIEFSQIVLVEDVLID